MESLEQALERVDNLAEGLHATLSVRDPIIRLPRIMEDGSCAIVVSSISGVVSQPDNETIGNSRSELIKMYNNSEWYSARYAAARKIGIGMKELESKLMQWSFELNHVIEGQTVRSNTFIQDHHVDVGVPSPVKVTLRDIGASRRAFEDAAELYAMSGSAYMSSMLGYLFRCGDNPHTREYAGIALGKSRFQVWRSEHYKIMTAVEVGTVAASLAAACGLIYHLT